MSAVANYSANFARPMARTTSHQEQGLGSAREHSQSLDFPSGSLPEHDCSDATKLCFKRRLETHYFNVHFNTPSSILIPCFSDSVMPGRSHMAGNK